MAQSNPLPRTKILEDAVIRIEEDTTIESFGDSTNRYEVGRESGNIKDIVEWESRGGSGDAGSFYRTWTPIGDMDIRNGGIRIVRV